VRPVRDRDGLLRAARSVAEQIEADRVIVVGSQAILLTWPDAPMALKITPEIGLYPENNRDWEARNPGFEASEEISALFGEMSAFHQSFGFYLDGVDENTAQMPPDWMKRAATAEIDVYGRTAVIICPAIQDVVVSKLHRLAEKDVDFIRECVAAGHIEVASVLAGLRATKPEPAILSRAQNLLKGMTTR